MSNEEKLLLKFLGFYFFTTSLSSIFLSVFLFKLGGFQAVAQYGVVSLIFLFIFYITSGYFLKKYSQVALIRIGLVILGLFYLLVFILKENSINYLIILGVINGIGNGNFWAGFNLAQYIATHEHSRNEYFGKLLFILNMAGAASPLIGGAIISYFGIIASKTWGYSFLFLLVSVLFFYKFLLAGKLIRHSGSQFTILDILRHKRATDWKIVLAQQFIYGLYDIAFGAFSAVLIFLIVKEEFNLGFVHTAETVAYGFASLVAIKILNKNKNYYIFGPLLSFLGLLLFAIEQNVLGIVFLVLFNNIFVPLMNISTSKIIYDVIDRSKEDWKNKYHFLVERDSILGAGRIITYLILLFFLGKENAPTIAKTWLFIIPIFPLIIGTLQFYYYRRQKASVESRS